MDFLRKLFSKVDNSKRNKHEDGIPYILSRPSNTSIESTCGTTEKCKVHSNADLIQKVNIKDVHNVSEAMEDEKKIVTEKVLSGLMQNFDNYLLKDNNIDKEKTIIKNVCKVSLDSVQNLDNAEHNTAVNDIGKEETKFKENINDNLLLDLDKLEIISLKYNEKELTELIDIKEPVNIYNILDNNDVIDLKGDMNTQDVHVTKIDKQDANEYDLESEFENKMEDILTIIDNDKRCEISNNEIAKYCVNNLDWHKSNQSFNNPLDILQTDTQVVSKGLFENIDTISISSDEDLPLSVYKSNITGVDVKSLSSMSILTEDNSDSIHDIKKYNEHDVSQVIIREEKHIISDFNDNVSECSYHSSDFEFISEKEACNIKPLNENSCVQKSSRANYFDYDMPGPSNLVLEDNYRENHFIPEGDDFFNLFQGLYAPELSNTHFFENKSLDTLSMNIDEIGFDMRILSKNIKENVSEKERKEADHSANRIMQMFPEENRRKRRRRY